MMEPPVVLLHGRRLRVHDGPSMRGTINTKNSCVSRIRLCAPIGSDSMCSHRCLAREVVTTAILYSVSSRVSFISSVVDLVCSRLVICSMGSGSFCRRTILLVGTGIASDVWDVKLDNSI